MSFDEEHLDEHHECQREVADRDAEIDRLKTALERIRARATGSIWAIANGALLSLPDSVPQKGHCACGFTGGDVAHLCHVPQKGNVNPLSEFIRNATPDEKAEVYGRVMDKVAEQQQAVLDRAASPQRGTE